MGIASLVTIMTPKDKSDDGLREADFFNVFHLIPHPVLRFITVTGSQRASLDCGRELFNTTARSFTKLATLQYRSCVKGCPPAVFGRKTPWVIAQRETFHGRKNINEYYTSSSEP